VKKIHDKPLVRLELTSDYEYEINIAHYPTASGFWFIASRLAQPSRVEALTRLNFVQDNVLKDPPTALQLNTRESNRICGKPAHRAYGCL
jgi:hypothetical protein